MMKSTPILFFLQCFLKIAIFESNRHVSSCVSDVSEIQTGQSNQVCGLSKASTLEFLGVLKGDVMNKGWI